MKKSLKRVALLLMVAAILVAGGYLALATEESGCYLTDEECTHHTYGHCSYHNYENCTNWVHESPHSSNCPDYWTNIYGWCYRTSEPCEEHSNEYFCEINDYRYCTNWVHGSNCSH